MIRYKYLFPYKTHLPSRLYFVYLLTTLTHSDKISSGRITCWWIASYPLEIIYISIYIYIYIHIYVYVYVQYIMFISYTLYILDIIGDQCKFTTRVLFWPKTCWNTIDTFLSLCNAYSTACAITCVVFTNIRLLEMFPCNASVMPTASKERMTTHASPHTKGTINSDKWKKSKLLWDRNFAV